jgi:molecular chaperone DnaK (HSP70)
LNLPENPSLDVLYKKYKRAGVVKGSLKGSIWIQETEFSIRKFFEKGTKVPCKNRQIIFPFKNNITKLKHYVFQKLPDRSDTKIYLGKVKIYGFPPTKGGKPPIGITIFVNTKGGIKIEADLANDITKLENGHFIQSRATFEFAIEKDGQRIGYSSVEEMPPEVKKIYYEHMKTMKEDEEAVHFDIDSGETSYKVRKASSKKAYIYKAKKYKRIDDIPDEDARRKYKEIEKRIANNAKNPRWRRFEVNCLNCGNLVIPKKSYFGKFKCPRCKKIIPRTEYEHLLL